MLMVFRCSSSEDKLCVRFHSTADSALSQVTSLLPLLRPHSPSQSPLFIGSARQFQSWLAVWYRTADVDTLISTSIDLWLLHNSLFWQDDDWPATSLLFALYTVSVDSPSFTLMCKPTLTATQFFLCLLFCNFFKVLIYSISSSSCFSFKTPSRFNWSWF